MDYKELVERLKYYGTTYAIGDNLGRGITGTDELMLNAADAITDLIEKVKSKTAEAERQRQTAKNWESNWNSELKLRKSAESRAEKAERERDYAIKQLKIAADENGGCWGCKWFDDMTEKCTNPEGVVSCNTRTNNMWEWRGLKEE